MVDANELLFCEADEVNNVTVFPANCFSLADNDVSYNFLGLKLRKAQYESFICQSPFVDKIIGRSVTEKAKPVIMHYLLRIESMKNRNPSMKPIRNISGK